MDEMLKLSWNDYRNLASNTFRYLLSDKEFTDVTLVCDDDVQIDAHKIVLSSASKFFRRVFVKNPHPKPLIYLKGLRYEDVKSILEFIYLGETEVKQNNVRRFMEIGFDLEVQGIDEKMSIADHRVEESDTEEDAEYVDAKRASSHCSAQENIEPKECENENQNIKDESFKETFKGIKSPFRSRIRSFSCRLCEKSFTFLSVLQRHNKIVHEGIRYPCNFCGHKFTTQSDLKRHNRAKHVADMERGHTVS
jgi:hypothetical protein